MNRPALGYASLSAVALLLALVLPIAHSDFSVELDGTLRHDVESFLEPCTELINQAPAPKALMAPLRQPLIELCERTLQQSWGPMRGELADQLLGPVRHDGELGSWSRCIPDAAGAFEPLESCAKSWAIHTLGIPVGPYWLLGVLLALLRRHMWIMSTAVVVFGLALPVTRTLLALGCSLSPRTREHWLPRLRRTGSWSLPDAFVVILVVLFFRVEVLTFSIQAGLGAYAFAAAGLLAALAAKRLETDESSSAEATAASAS